MPRDYDNFALEVSREGAEYVSRVSVAGLGDARQPFLSPFCAGELEALFARRSVVYRDLRRVEGSGERKSIQQIGQRLFSTVLGGRVGGFWEACLRQTKQTGKGLRLQLRLRSPELWSWPWEYLCDPESDFLAFLPDVSIARYPEIPHPIQPLRVDPPLRVLVAAAYPRDCQPLGVASEWESVRSAWESVAFPGRVELELLERATLAKVRGACGRPFHIFHFIGHGDLNLARRQGILLFENRQGEKDPVTGRELARVLRRLPALRLVVLNACQSARAAGDDPWSGVAQRLLHDQIPSVVAMQFPVADAAAITFSRRFYEVLAEGMPVDAAVSEARLELVTERFDLEWGNPVLYLRSPEGQLFVVATPDSPTAPQAGQPEKKLEEERQGLPETTRWWKVGVVSVTLAITAGMLLLVHGKGPIEDPLAARSDPLCPSPAGLSMPFVRIGPGTFTMGSDEGPSDQRPAHQVTITRSFCIGRFEVTQGQWEKVMGKRPRRKYQGRHLPVGGISWNDAGLFVSALNRLDPGVRYRLPTEAQWEFAARAGTEGRQSFGNPQDLIVHGNCRASNVGDGFEGLAPTGSFRKNPWGLYDMYGNVSEWVADWFGPYSSAPLTDPPGPASGEEKVRRGGSFEYAIHCDSIFRTGSKPQSRNEAYGFRLVRDPVP